MEESTNYATEPKMENQINSNNYATEPKMENQINSNNKDDNMLEDLCKNETQSWKYKIGWTSVEVMRNPGINYRTCDQKLKNISEFVQIDKNLNIF